MSTAGDDRVEVLMAVHRFEDLKHKMSRERRERIRAEALLLSTLRSYVKALGGELEVIANFGDKRIRLHSA